MIQIKKRQLTITIATIISIKKQFSIKSQLNNNNNSSSSSYNKLQLIIQLKIPEILQIKANLIILELVIIIVLKTKITIVLHLLNLILTMTKKLNNF